MEIFNSLGSMLDALSLSFTFLFRNCMQEKVAIFKLSILELLCSSFWKVLFGLLKWFRVQTRALLLGVSPYHLCHVSKKKSLN